MLKSKREFSRFDLPLIVKFRPSYGATRYSLGLTKNLSFNGLGIEARDFNFIKNENLEMEVKFPQNGSSVSLSGDIVWKKQVGSNSIAGISLKIKDKELQKELMGKISANWNIPLDSIISKGDSDYGKDVAIEKKISKPVKKISKITTQASETGFTKKYLKNGICKVIFRLPKEAASEAREVAIVGDFNEWDQSKTFMTPLKNGDFNATLEIPAGREYRFRYLIDGTRWENDWQADKYLPNDFGCDDSILSL
jgi:hypothetical protein